MQFTQICYTNDSSAFVIYIQNRSIVKNFKRIAADPTRVQTPIIEAIDHDSFAMGVTKTKGMYEFILFSIFSTFSKNFLEELIFSKNWPQKMMIYCEFCIH